MRRISLALLILLPALDAFAPKLPGCHPRRQSLVVDENEPSPFTALHAKKRRRRKSPANPQASDGASAAPSQNAFDATNELPDFELKEEIEEQQASATAAVKKQAAAITDPDVITPAMMGSSTSPSRSVKELISDRSLEQNFEFDTTTASTDGGASGGEALPDLVEMMKGQQTTGDQVPGKKKARQAERRAAAMAREQQERDEEAGALDFLNGVPFVTDEETGKVTYLKVVEAGTWLSIFILIGWEVYINSPFFDRAAPNAPIVF